MNQPKAIQVAMHLVEHGYINQHQVEAVARHIDNEYGTETFLLDRIKELECEIETMRVNHRLQLTCGSK
ncbi:MAG: hypothetical protein JKX85_06235 [Phycisphaeraceae bacterium]|nr:hypothetical protein [Phycisphaeraceae bacterium]